MTGNIALLRRFSLIAMALAIISGSVSLILLFTGVSSAKLLFVISIAALIVGFLLDRRITMLDGRNAG